ncbi:MAG: hypothetical protein K940chlam5_01709 [Candidatus Anoxychlamydiales bacterium]|nr:hypothetical protein [Candidatus Anoxychlamydiales bacterium]
MSISSTDMQKSLMKAAETGDTPSAIALISEGADVNESEDGGWTVLMEATSKGYTETALALIDEGADINMQLPNGITALKCAAANGFGKTVKALMAKTLGVFKDNISIVNDGKIEFIAIK